MLILMTACSPLWTVVVDLIHVVDIDVDVDVYIYVDNDNFEIDVDFDNDRFTSFKQYINHLLSKACAAAKKEVFLIRFCSVDQSKHPLVFDVNSLMDLVSYWMNAKLSLIG